MLTVYLACAFNRCSVPLRRHYWGSDTLNLSGHRAFVLLPLVWCGDWGGGASSGVVPSRDTGSKFVVRHKASMAERCDVNGNKLNSLHLSNPVKASPVHGFKSTGARLITAVLLRL
ncbi:hypothetical protein TNCV_2258411 [Trichonephila clavipes]|nr:hypothetical protein TNCV_2258411 [Trichonephila clavipes]